MENNRDKTILREEKKVKLVASVVQISSNRISGKSLDESGINIGGTDFGQGHFVSDTQNFSSDWKEVKAASNASSVGLSQARRYQDAGQRMQKVA